MNPPPSENNLINFTALRRAVLWPDAAGAPEPILAKQWFDLFDNMQGNILKAHGRPLSALVMFRLGDTPVLAARNRAFLRAWETEGAITSTWRQLNDQWDRKDRQADPAAPVASEVAARGEAPFCSLLLTQSGVMAAGLSGEACPPDPAFTSRMESRNSRENLRDLPAGAAGTPADPWSAEYLQPIDAIALLAHDNAAGLAKLVGEAWERGRRFGVRVTTIENGFAWKPPSAGGDFKEPFGFTDGLSNPIFLQEDAAKLEGPPRVTPLDAVVLAAPAALAGSSYAVFRKLETQTEEFKKFEKDLRTGLGASVRRDPAQVLIGRTRDGQSLEPAGPLGRNDFDFNADRPPVPPPARCPYHAHIRKANPRVPGAAVIVRRSAIYADGGGPLAEKLEGTRGLLFVAYLSSIRSQFERLYVNWLMGAASPEPGLGDVGVDPLLAPASAITGNYRLNFPGAPVVAIDRPRLVVPRGGRYAFVPSRAWLRALPL